MRTADIAIGTIDTTQRKPIMEVMPAVLVSLVMDQTVYRRGFLLDRQTKCPEEHINQRVRLLADILTDMIDARVQMS